MPEDHTLSRLVPFRGWRYPAGQPLERLVTPPYDVISAAARERLAHSHAHNFVHLILPQAAGDQDRYQQAAATLVAWQRQGVLQQDSKPGLTLHRQTCISDDGRPLTRTGVVGLLSLPEAEAGSVRAHENTLPGPRQDRLHLMRATQAHLSPIFMLAPDPEGDLEMELHAACQGAGEEFVDADGVQHWVAVNAEPGFAERVGKLLRARRLIIADGHHRYESALACYRQVRDAGPPAVARGAAKLLVHVVSLASPGLSILPIHRTVRGLRELDSRAFLDRLRRSFRVEELPLSGMTMLEGRDDLLRLVKAGGRGTFGVALASERCFHLLHISPPANPSSLLETMDVSLLHEAVLSRELGIRADAVEEHVGFVKDPGRALDAVQSGAAQMAFILNPTALEQLRQVTDAGLKMPQKSTYFYPKVPAGLVVHSFDG